MACSHKGGEIHYSDEIHMKEFNDRKSSDYYKQNSLENEYS